MTSTITVRYFAALREAVGASEEFVEYAQGESVADLYGRLAQRHSFKLNAEHLRFAVNDRFVSANREIVAGDLVVFIPPVAGG